MRELPPTLAEHLLAHCDGHPLFGACVVEDWLAHSGPQGDDAPRWPTAHALEPGGTADTAVAALVEERLERMTPSLRRTVETAAVLGTHFDTQELEAALADQFDEAALAGLAQHRYFFETRGEQSWPDGTRGTHYQFSHELIRAPILRSVVASRKRSIVAAALQRLEAGFGADTKPVLDRLLAHSHAIDDDDRITRYEFAAAVRAHQRLSFVLAAAHLETALEAGERLAATPARRTFRGELLRYLAAMLLVDGRGDIDSIVELTDEAIAIAQDDQDVRAEFGALITRISHLIRSGRARAAESVATRLVELAARDPSGLMSAALTHRGLLSAVYGKFPAAADDFLAASAAIDYSAGIAAARVARMASMYRALAWFARGYFKLGDADMERAQQIADERGDPHDVADLAYFRCLAALRVEDRAGVHRWSSRVLELDAEHGFAVLARGAGMLRDWAGLTPRNATDRAAGMRDAHLARQQGGEYWDDTVLGYLRIDAHIAAGEWDAADDAFQQTLNLAECTGEEFYVPELWRQRARWCLASHDAGPPATEPAAEALRISMAKAWEQDAGCALGKAADALAALPCCTDHDREEIRRARVLADEREGA